MKFRIEIELEKIEGGKSELARFLKVKPQAVDIVYKKKNPRFSTKRKHTKAFNEAFKTKFTEDYLFTLVEGEIE